ncbi:MAG: hypothetical protein ABSG65_27730 [Bryobacteraceae bacterium]
MATLAIGLRNVYVDPDPVRGDGRKELLKRTGMAGTVLCDFQ